jgi:hypothetical protein
LAQERTNRNSIVLVSSISRARLAGFFKHSMTSDASLLCWIIADQPGNRGTIEVDARENG